ncbi:increased loss of mitochondrial DNA protein 1 [Usnea florida]
MAIFSAQSLIRTVTLFHLTISYYLFTSPAIIASHSLVYVLGASMELPDPPPSLSRPSPAATLAALFLTLLGLSDLTSSGLSEEVGSHYWSSQAPVRLAFFFAVTGYSFAGKPGGLLGGKVGTDGDGLCNSVVFTWAFLEMLWWFWIYVTVRDEKRELTVKAQERRKAETDRL